VHRTMLRKNNDRIISNYGFTLLEVMVSVVILMVAMLGTFQAINLALDKNVENSLRQKGMAVAEQQLNDLKARPFDNITGTNLLSTVRVSTGSAFKNYSVQRLVTDLAASNSHTKQVSIRVWWLYRGQPYQHQVVTGVGSNELGGR
jgi:prepilin-type N-terminal cleavage/methylation domain-containing protein